MAIFNQPLRQMTPEQYYNTYGESPFSSGGDSGANATRGYSVAMRRSGSSKMMPGAFAIGGSILGGMAGAVGGPAGVVAGGIAGATAGGAAGESIQQGIETTFGEREQFDPMQITKSAVGSGAAQAIFPAGGVAIKAITPAVRTGIVGIMSNASGMSKPIVQQLLTRTSGVRAGLAGGADELYRVVQKSAARVNQYVSEIMKQSKNAVSELNKLSVVTPGAKQAVLEKGRQFVTNVRAKLNKSYNIGSTKAGELIFDRAKNPSNIVNTSDQNAIREAFRSMSTITKDVSIRHIDAVMERLMVLRSKTPGGTPTGAETKRIIGDMMDEIVGFIKTVDVPSKAKTAIFPYRDYATFLENQLPVRVFANELKQLFGNKANLTRKEIETVSSQLLRMFGEGRVATRELAETAGREIGEDIVGTTAGVIAQSGRTTSGLATSAGGAIQKVANFIPDKIIKNYAETGRVTGEMARNPVIKVISFLTGMTPRAILQDVVESDKQTR